MESGDSSVNRKTIKILIIGESGVGKSSITQRYVNGSFAENHGATIGVDIMQKAVLVEGLRYNVEFWDTAGSERFRALTPSFFRRALGVILVYDIGNRKSFLELQRWYDETFVYVDSAVVLVMANKLDAGRVVEREEGVRFARHHATMFMEVSAKDNTNICDSIDHLVNKIVAKMKAEPVSTNDPTKLLDYTGPASSQTTPSGNCSSCSWY